MLMQRFIAIFISLFCIQCAVADTATSKPNFVMILADDLGYQDLGCFGSPLIKTPRIDQMAKEGMRFTSFYGQPVCGPSRAALMTGCYPLRIAKKENRVDVHFYVHTKEVMIPEILKPLGYATAAFGKWDMAGHSQTDFDPALMPNKQGFDYYFGTPSSNDKNVNLLRNEKMIEKNADMSTLTRRYTDEAIQFITDNKKQPFFVYLAHSMPHTKLAASKDFAGKSARGLYGDVVEEIDFNTGRLLDKLKELGVDDNTYVVFTSDNGPWWSQGENGGSALPLRGAKTSTWDGGQRVPCIVRAPGKIPAGKACDDVTTSMDLLPTLAKLSGGQLPKDRVIDGHDISGVMHAEKDATIPDNVFFYYQHTQLQAVRSGRWKLVLPRSAATSAVPPIWGKMIAPGDRDDIKEPLLFDLDADVGEKKDVAAIHPQVVAELMKKIEWALEDIGDNNLIGKNARFFDPQPKRPDIKHLPMKKAKVEAKDGVAAYPVDFTYSVAIDHEHGVTRRDPSDVIMFEGKYFVWYSKVTKGPGISDYPSGYSAEVWYATSPDGQKWTEQGMAIGKGAAGAWDERGVFTPNILRFDGKHYLYYTGVATNHNKSTPTKLGGSVADAPTGPWKKFEGNPILTPSNEEAQFDSMRVDDIAFVVRDGKIWLYYKGRMKGKGPDETKLGVAFGDSPTGPFKKHGEPLHAGHEVTIWPQGKGVASLATAAGPRMVYGSVDGLKFEARNEVKNPPSAPGAYRKDNFENNPDGKGLEWGICHVKKGQDLYLMRFDCIPRNER